MIPTTLAGWTLSALREVVNAGLAENDLFDLKADLQDAEGQRKIVAAFANTNGGFLIFGVTNARAIVGVLNEELPRDFGSKLRAGLEQSVEYTFAPPFDVGNQRRVYIAHVPKSKRAPHAVLLNNAWAFLKRTAAGSNDPMTYEEIRIAFRETARRRSELGWFISEVERIYGVAEGLHTAATGSDLPKTHLLLNPFEAAQLNAYLPTIFDDIGDNKVLVENLQRLIAGCARVDRTLAPLALHATLPRERSSSGGQFDAREFVAKESMQIIIAARNALKKLKALG